MTFAFSRGSFSGWIQTRTPTSAFLPSRRVQTSQLTSRPVLSARAVKENQTHKRAGGALPVMVFHLPQFQSHNDQVLPLSCQSQRPLNYSALCVLLMLLMPAKGSHEPGSAGRKRAAKAFHKDGTAFICRTGSGSLWDAGSHSADEPYHLYRARFLWRAAIDPFFQYAKHLTCYGRKFRPYPRGIQPTVNLFSRRLLEGLLYLD